MHRTRALVAASLAVVLTASLAACTPENTEVLPTPEASSSATAAPAPMPTFDPEGTALANLEYFDAVNTATIKAARDAGLPARRGKKLINALVAAGFAKEDMEVTPDRTAISLDADAVVFSVRLSGDCLIGQYGIEGYKSMVAPMLGTRKCLVGVTRKIDW